MDAKITKKRLSHLLSYDWIKIVAIAAAVIFVWVLIFSVTATKITPAQQFVLINHYSCYLNDDYQSKFLSTTDFFSYEVIERRIDDLQSTGKSDAYTLLDARLGISEGDVMFIPGIDDPDTKTLVDGTGVNDDIPAEYTYQSYVERFTTRYYSYVYNLYPTLQEGDEGYENELKRTYFYQMEQFLNAYYNGDWENGERDDAKIERDFRTRVKKDNRFKKESQIKQGVKDELERIDSYKAALAQFNEYLNEGVVSFTQSKIELYEDEYVTGNFSLNICPADLTDDPTKEDSNGEAGGHMFQNGYSNALAEKVYYYATDTYPDANDPEITLSKKVKTAINMNMIIFRYADVGYGFQYESLLYINDLIADCLAETDGTNG